ncbi:MAG: S41 family peptidase, partial [Actinobacteria bacterium]|nr:S41 family peptidase [Actinomycetota bacterium]
DELTVPTVEVRHPAPGVGYIRIPDFESDIPGLVVDGLIALDEEPYTTLVVDLRDNPGGFIDSAIAVMSEFVDGGVILVESDGTDEFEYEAIEGGHATNKRLLVLVNQGTASAAEVLAAALRDTRDAVIIGEATFGKHAIQIVFDLNNGAEFHLAIAHWVSPKGVSVRDGGLIPDHQAVMPASMSPSELVDLAMETTG